VLFGEAGRAVAAVKLFRIVVVDDGSMPAVEIAVLSIVALIPLIKLPVIMIPVVVLIFPPFMFSGFTMTAR